MQSNHHNASLSSIPVLCQQYGCSCYTDALDGDIILW